MHQGDDVLIAKVVSMAAMGAIKPISNYVKDMRAFAYLY